MSNNIPTLRLDKRKTQIAMINADVTVPQIADQMGVTRQTVYNIISGRNTTLDTVSKIAAAIGVDPLSILTQESQP